MALPLDRFTLEVVLVAVSGLMSLMMANTWLTNRHERGVAAWFATTVAGLIVFGVIAGMDTQAGGPSWLFGARNTASFLLAISLIGGMIEFRGRRGTRWWRPLGGIGLAFAIAMAVLADDARARLLLFDVSSITAMVCLAVAMVWRAPSNERRSLRFGTIAPIGLAGVLATRLWTTWHAGPGMPLPDPDAQNAVFLMTALFNITMTHTATLVLYQRAQSRTERLAMEDALTGLVNRRAFDDRFGLEMARVTRTQTPFALVLIDVNDLKLVNDRHGHAAGDRLLATVGARLRTFVRDADVAARLGGDEFGLLLAGVSDPAALESTLQRLRAATEGSVEVAPGLHLDLRLSLGGAIWGAPSKERQGILGTADRALYDDKARAKLRS